MNTSMFCASGLPGSIPESYIPEVNDDHVHHFDLHLCEEPGSTAKLWNRNDTDKAGHQAGLPTAPICNVHKVHMLVAGYSCHSKAVTFPENASMEAGWATKFKYLVFEIHFKPRFHFEDGEKDNSKCRIQYQTNPTAESGGALIMSTVDQSIVIPKHSKRVLVMSTVVPQRINLVLFRGHTHALGVKVALYWAKKNRNETEENELIEVGSMSPYPRQHVQPTNTRGPLEPGDKLVAKCFYNNTRDVDVHIGELNSDEMCFVDIMYTVEYGQPMLTNIVIQEEGVYKYEDK